MKIKIPPQYITVIFIVIVSLIAGCSSQFEEDQQTTQIEYATTCANNLQETIITFVEFVENNINDLEDVSAKNFIDLQDKFPFAETCILFSKSGDIPKYFPDNLDVTNFTNILAKNKISKKFSNYSSPTLMTLSPSEDLYLLLPIVDDMNLSEHLLFVKVNNDELFGNLAKQYFPLPYQMIITLRDHEVLFHSDPEWKGSEFSDLPDGTHIPAFDDLFKMMVQNSSGYQTELYSYKGKSVSTLFCWEYLELYGERIWVVLTRNINKIRKNENKGVFLLASLRSIAVKDTLLNAVLENNIENQQIIFEDIFYQNPEIYSLQFADSLGTIISGFPKGNSIIGYNYHLKKNLILDNSIKNCLQESKMQADTYNLFETGEANLICLPVELKGDILGVLICTQKEK
ncbi:MAG: hypothetical protein U9P79_08130 [Candidatus Cloacimonadota bacterium]|nr:hypothetical protein [Candidatus Cloacimonadota bacterium]